MKNDSSHADHRSDSGFDAMLRSAIPRTPLPHTFRQNVWRQIESAGEESAAGCIRRCFGNFLLFMARPVPAASAMVITVAAGLWLGAREADARGESAYKISVSPFAESHHPESDK